MKSRPWGRKTPPASTHRPRRLPHPPRLRLHFRARVHTSPVRVHTSVPAFTLPPHGLRRRPRRLRHPAVAVIHNGLSTEKLSTSFLLTLCKTFSPRACARVYIIYRSLVGRSRGVSAPLRKRVRAVVTPCPAPPCAGWGRARQRRTPPRAVPNHAACVPNHCAQRRKCTRQSPPLPVRSPRVSPPTAAPLPLVCRITVRKGGVHKVIPAPARAFSPRQPAYGRALCPLMGEAPCVLPASARLRPRPCPLMGEVPSAGWGRAKAKAEPPRTATRTFPAYRPPPPPKWAPRLRRREGKRPNGAPPHRNAHTPNAERKRYLHNSRTKTQRRTKRCAQFVIFVFTPCKLLHNFSTVLHRSPRNVPERAQIAARRPDLPCFTARFPPLSPESHRAKHPRTAPVLPPKNALLRAYAKPRPHSRVRGTRQHATTCAFFTFSARYERGGGTRNANFCPAEGRKWGRFRSQMLKNGPQTKKSTFSFGRLVI